MPLMIHAEEKSKKNRDNLETILFNIWFLTRQGISFLVKSCHKSIKIHLKQRRAKKFSGEIPNPPPPLTRGGVVTLFCSPLALDGFLRRATF